MTNSVGKKTTYLISLLGREPLLQFAECPNALALICAFGVDDASNAVLHAVNPLAAILAPVGVGVGSFSVLLVESVVTFVLATILPHVVAETVHYSVLKRTLEVAAVGPLESAETRHFVGLPHARVLAAVRPVVASFALFDTVAETAVIVAAVAPDLNAQSILFLLNALRCFRLHFERIQVFKNVVAWVLTEYRKICLSVLLPKSFVSLATRLRCTKHANAPGLPVDPVSFEGAAVGPLQFTIPTLVELVLSVSLELRRTVWCCSLLSYPVVLLVAFGFLILDECLTHLADEFEGAEFHRSVLELAVFEAQFCRQGVQLVSKGFIAYFCTRQWSCESCPSASV